MRELRRRKRLSTALLLSLLLHALLLSLSLGGAGLGLPGLNLPWRERRLGADDLRVTLLPAPVKSAAAAAVVEAPPIAWPEPVAAAATGALEAEQVPAPAPSPSLSPSPSPAPTLTSLARTDSVTWAVARVPASSVPVAITAPAVGASSPELVLTVPSDVADAAQKQIALVASARALEIAQEKARLAQAEQEARAASERQAQELAVARLAAEAARQDAERQQVARQEAKQEAKQEAIRQAAVQQDLAAKQAAARQELERAERMRLEAAQQEAAKQEAANIAKAAAAAARAEQDAKREAARRAMGRQLDEEAARRDAAALAARQPPASSLLPSASGARRGRLFGRSDPNAEMLLYAELWSRKIELNQTFDMIRAAVKQPHAQPLVTVAVRSDGSIESVNFVRSSGVAEIDAGIRRIVESQAPFPPFHPALAREFDVIEIRRSWSFDTAIRLN